MALNPLISLQAQAPNAGGAINNGLLNAQNIQKIQGNKLAMDEATQMAELKSMVLGGEGARVAFQQGGREGLTKFLMNRIEAGPTVKGGRGMQDTQEFLDMVSDLSIPDEQITGVLDNIRGVGERYKILQPSQQGGVSESDKMLFDLNKKRLEETRSDIRASYKDLDSRVRGISDNYNKVLGLSKEVLNNNRQAVAGTLVALVKSGDPNSAVLAGEMAAALNLEGIEETLSSGNFDPEKVIQSIQSQMAALRPENMDVANIMNVAQKYRNAQAQSIEDEYDMTNEQLGKLPQEGQYYLKSEKREKRFKDFLDYKNRTTPAWFDVVGISEDNINATIEKAKKEKGITLSRDAAIKALELTYKIRKR